MRRIQYCSQIWFFLLSFLGFLFSAQNNAQAASLVPVKIQWGKGNGLVTYVHADGVPLAHVKVFVEKTNGTKLMAEGETDSLGYFNSNDLLATEVIEDYTVTAFLPGYTVVSVQAKAGHEVTIELSKIKSDQLAFISGEVRGFQLDEDDAMRATLSVVTKPFVSEDLAQIDVNAFISPTKDEIEIIKKFNIPSNFVFPEQTVPLYYIPVTVDKPGYRLPIYEGTNPGRLIALAGSFNAQEALETFQAGNNWALLNLIQFKQMGWADVNYNKADIYLTKKNSSARQFALARANQDNAGFRRWLIGLAEIENGVFAPTDIKQVIQNNTELALPSAMKNRAFDVLSEPNNEVYRATRLDFASEGSADDVLKTNGIPNDTLKRASAALTNDSYHWLNSATLSQMPEADLMVARAQNPKNLVLNGSRYQDLWIMVLPYQRQIQYPVWAKQRIFEKKPLTLPNLLAVDYIDTDKGSYPYVSGEKIAANVKKIERHRYKIENQK